jgi:hypothetical protein
MSSRLGGLISAYRSGGDDMPMLNAAVLQDLDQLHLALRTDEMTKKSDHLEVVDTTGLTDADWAEINKLKNAYAGGQKALSAALDDLAKDPSRTARVLGALFPDLVREATKDKMAESGITEEDLRELIRKLENPTQSRH